LNRRREQHWIKVKNPATRERRCAAPALFDKRSLPDMSSNNDLALNVVAFTERWLIKRADRVCRVAASQQSK
jgi:hypothetical protein